MKASGFASVFIGCSLVFDAKSIHLSSKTYTCVKSSQILFAWFASRPSSSPGVVSLPSLFKTTHFPFGLAFVLFNNIS